MSVIWLMMNPLYSSWNNALDYSRYPRGNTAPTVLPQMHYRYRGSTVHSVPSPRYYREILPIPTVITAVTAVLPHSPLPCHSLVRGHLYKHITQRVSVDNLLLSRIEWCRCFAITLTIFYYIVNNCTNSALLIMNNLTTTLSLSSNIRHGLYNLNWYKFCVVHLQVV